MSDKEITPDCQLGTSFDDATKHKAPIVFQQQQQPRGCAELEAERSRQQMRQQQQM